MATDCITHMTYTYDPYYHICDVCMCIHVYVVCNTSYDPTMHVCVMTNIARVILCMIRLYDVVCMYGDERTDT